MISFENDYSESAHPQVMQALLALGSGQFPGYGEDPLTQKAQNWLQQQIGQPQARLYFVSGGTQANLTVIASFLRPHQGVIAADTGHIATHEAGAIEATGHKVLAVQNQDGKLKPEDITRLTREHREDASFEHTVQPGMVYISNTTELGTCYTVEELRNLHAVSQQEGLPLFVDGARLGHAMAAEQELNLQTTADCCDAFTIGLTKQGALFGEGIVIANPALQRDFRYHIKQRGGMLAKGWLMAAQFLALMEGDHYMRLSRWANRQALIIREALAARRVPFLCDSPSNQQFPILSDSIIEQLRQAFAFHTIQRVDEKHSAVRFVTSWATRQQDVEALVRALDRLLTKG